MGILSDIKKIKRYVKTSFGYQLLSQWTSSQTVEMDDGTVLENKMESVEKNISNEIERATAKENKLESTLTWIDF